MELRFSMFQCPMLQKSLATQRQGEVMVSPRQSMVSIASMGSYQVHERTRNH